MLMKVSLHIMFFSFFVPQVNCVCCFVLCVFRATTMAIGSWLNASNCSSVVVVLAPQRVGHSRALAIVVSVNQQDYYHQHCHYKGLEGISISIPQSWCRPQLARQQTKLYLEYRGESGWRQCKWKESQEANFGAIHS